MKPEDCDHLLLYVTTVSGLEDQGYFWRCRDCFEYWPMDEMYAEYRQRHVMGMDEPDEWGYNSNGDVVDLR